MTALMSSLMSAVTVLADDGSAGAAAAPAQKTLLEYIRSGGVVGLILIFLSITAVTLLIMHLIQVRRTALVPVEAATELQRLFRENDIPGAIRYCERNDSFLVRVFYTALTRCSRSPFGFMEIRSALEEAGQREADRLNRSTDLIGLIAAMGPMLGLLGTVLGMIGAFAAIGQLEGAARSKELAGFMSLALVNTAEGLAVAIPCTAAFSILRRRLDRLIADAGEVVENLAVYIENPSGAERAPGRPRGPTVTRPAGPGQGMASGIKAS